MCHCKTYIAIVSLAILMSLIRNEIDEIYLETKFYYLRVVCVLGLYNKRIRYKYGEKIITVYIHWLRSAKLLCHILVTFDTNLLDLKIGPNHVQNN